LCIKLSYCPTVPSRTVVDIVHVAIVVDDHNAHVAFPASGSDSRNHLGNVEKEPKGLKGVAIHPDHGLLSIVRSVRLLMTAVDAARTNFQKCCKLEDRFELLR